jgi:hypothetical protein
MHFPIFTCKGFCIDDYEIPRRFIHHHLVGLVTAVIFYLYGYCQPEFILVILIIIKDIFFELRSIQRGIVIDLKQLVRHGDTIFDLGQKVPFNILKRPEPLLLHPSFVGGQVNKEVSCTQKPDDQKGDPGCQLCFA